jgi:hypothetical protein
MKPGAKGGWVNDGEPRWASNQSRPAASSMDEMSRAFHDLGNILNAFTFRIAAFEKIDLDPVARDHVEALQRLTRRGMALLDQVRDLHELARH